MKFAKVEGGEVADVREVGDLRDIMVGDCLVCRPGEEHYRQAGWLEYVEPVLGEFQSLGAMRFSAGQCTYAVDDWPAQDILAALIAAAKAEARRRILAIIPEWKQANATARAVEIVYDQLLGQASESDLAELAAIQGVHDRVKAIRVASDLIEGDIVGGMVSATSQVVTSPRWPVT